MPAVEINFNPNRLFLMLLLALLAVAAVHYTFEYFPQYSYFGAAVAKVSISVILFWVIDTYLLPEIDTVTEIKNGNIAYALVILAYAIIVAAAISTA